MQYHRGAVGVSFPSNTCVLVQLTCVTESIRSGTKEQLKCCTAVVLIVVHAHIPLRYFPRLCCLCCMLLTPPGSEIDTTSGDKLHVIADDDRSSSESIEQLSERYAFNVTTNAP